MFAFVRCLLLGQFLSVAASLEISSWLTQSDSAGNAIHLLEAQPSLSSTESSTPPKHLRGKDGWLNIDINPSNLLQKMEGFGAGLPQSSAYVLYNLKKRNYNLYQSTMQKLFSKETGMGMNILRFPIGSCDFSIHNTSYDESWWDWNLEHFAIDADSEYIVSVLLDVKAMNPDLLIIGERTM